MPPKTAIPALTLLWCAAFGGPTDSLVWNEFRPRLNTDFGHVVRGDYQGASLRALPLNRNTVTLEQSGSYAEAWTFDAGLQAVIWWPFFPNASQPHERTIRVEPRVSILKARRELGEDAFIEFGFFPYKYNPDAVNLGEYLYRSGAYPGIVRTTDGLRLMDYAAYDAYGAHAGASHAGGRLRHDFNLFTELTSVPIGDLTPAYELSLDFPLLKLGAGAAWNRLLSSDGARVRPRDYGNGYFEVDSAGGGGVEFRGPYGLAPNSVKSRIQTGDSTVRTLHYYSQRGIKLMARAALDLGFVIPERLRNPGDLRLFVEAALLGWENQPYFYEDRAERIPVMVGAHVPTLRLLDRLTVQAEYYRAPFASAYDFNYYGYPVWTVKPGYDPEAHARDDWKWSVSARRAVNRLLTVHAQVANDHLRLPEFNTNPSETPLTQAPGNWYYLLRLESRL